MMIKLYGIATPIKQEIITNILYFFSSAIVEHFKIQKISELDAVLYRHIFCINTYF